MPPRSTINSRSRQYEVAPIDGQPDPIDPTGPIDDNIGPIDDHIGPIPDQAGIASITPSNIPNPNSNDTAIDALGAINALNITDNSDRADVRITNSAAPHSRSPVIQDAQRDASLPSLSDVLHSVQMSQPTHFDALARMMRALGATADEADRWTMNHLFGDDQAAASLHQIQITDEAIRRTRLAYPDLHPGALPTQPIQPAAAVAADNGALIISRNGSAGATVSGQHARFNISYPPRFKPHETNWFLWVPQVERFLNRVKIDPTILCKSHAHLFSPDQHANVLSVISEIAPERESEWFARLNFKHAYSAWDELAHAYAPRAELELQAKIEDLENISQSETESIREWTLRLRRLVLEVKAMQGDHVVTETAHKLKLLRIRPIAGQEDGFSSFLGELRHTLHLKTVAEVESKLTAYEDGIQMQARLRPAGAQIWHTYAGGKMASTNVPRKIADLPLPTAATFKRPPKGHCFICFNDSPSKLHSHHMKDCFKKDRPIGQAVANLMKDFKAHNPSPVNPRKRGNYP